jgi:WD40 repeat protein
MTKDTYHDPLSEGLPTPEQSARTTPTRIGGYTLIREIGAGGMGTVYEAEQDALKRRVALKILAPHLSLSTTAIQRFKREGEAAGRQQHPNIVAIHDVGEENGVHYIAQELVLGGRNLRDYIDNLRHRTHVPKDYYEVVANLFIKCASALQHAHESGVVHRDIKPANIMLTPDEDPMVADFGLALVEDEMSLSRTGQLAGTPYYMSPEQAASRRMGIDHRSDIFSLGVTLYEALTFTRAFSGDTSQQVIEQILLEDPTNPCKLRSRVPPELSAICLKAVEKKREHRYQTMTEFGADLQRFLDNEAVLAKPPSILRRIRKWTHRHPVRFVVFIATCVIGVLLADTFAHYRSEAQLRQDSEAAMWEAKGLTMKLSGAPGAALAVARIPPPSSSTPQQHIETLTSRLMMNPSFILPGHRGAIAAVTVSPDGQYLVTGSSDRTVRVWEYATGQLKHNLEGHQKSLSAIAVTPDSKQLVTVSHDSTVRVWNLETGALRLVLEGHQGSIYTVAITPDGKQIVTGGADSTARVWDLQTGEALKVITGHEAMIFSLAITPDGTRLVTGSMDNTARIWNLQTGQLLQVLTGHQAHINAVAISSDGAHLVTGSYDNTARIWNLKSGALLSVLKDHQDNIVTVAISPDGTRVVTGSYDKTARVWDLETGKILHVLKGHESRLYTVAFSPNGTHLLTGSRDKTVRIWNLDTSALRKNLIQDERLFVNAYTPDGKSLLFAQAKVAYLQNLQTGQLTRAFEGHENVIYAAAITQDGKRLITGDTGDTVRVWDIGSGEELSVLKGHEQWILSIALTPDGKRLVTGSTDKTVRIWDLDTGTTLRVLKDHKSAIYALAITPDGKHLVTGSHDYKARVWNLDTGERLQTFDGHTAPIYAATITPNGTHAITGSADTTARLWDLESGQLVRTFIGHHSTIKSIAVTPDGERLVTGSWDKTSRVWDLKTGQVLQILEGHDDQIMSIDVSPDGNELVTGSRDQSVRFWDIDPVNNPKRTLPELIAYAGTFTNYRPCQNTRDVVPVVPFPAPNTIWAPKALCTAWNADKAQP